MRVPRCVAALLLCTLGCCEALDRRVAAASHSLSAPREPTFTRLKRKNLAVDFVIPAAFRNSLRDLLGLFPAGAVNTNFQASSSLALDCRPLLGTLLHPGMLHPGRGDLKREPQRAALSKVLKSGFLKSLRRSKQLLLEVGEEMIREGCGAAGWEPGTPGKNHSTQEPGSPLPAESLNRKLEFNLTELFSWWLKSKEGRLRIRLMPERSASFPGREDTLSGALRASQPRLMFQILRKAPLEKETAPTSVIVPRNSHGQKQNP